MAMEWEDTIVDPVTGEKSKFEFVLTLGSLLLTTEDVIATSRQQESASNARLCFDKQSLPSEHLDPAVNG